MKKRLICALLTVIMLVSLVPATVLTASAASYSIGESAITVLKQWEGYKKNCVNGYTGYGTKCNQKGEHASHVTTEKQADEALRAELKELDKAINTFASKNGVSLTQNKHDALVLFSFANGTAWTTGTGDFKTAVVTGATGSKFLNAICWWNSSTADDSRRMVEANMYLNGKYDTAVPANFIRVKYNANGGKLNEAEYRYYDTNEKPTPDVVPTNGTQKFLGWYTATSNGKQVTSLTSNAELYAVWQNGSAVFVSYERTVGKTELYESVAAGAVKLPIAVSGKITIDQEFVDKNNVRWGRVRQTAVYYDENGNTVKDKDVLTWLGKDAWINLGKVAANGTTTENKAPEYEIDVKVTVTNTTANIRANASVTSAKLGTARKGDQFRIVNTEAGSGFMWGQIADEDGNGECDGWIALMYTNFDAVKDEDQDDAESTNVIGTATIIQPVNGYVNLRNGAGTNNQIVGALPYKARVDIYEIQYVNGIRWGRTSGGWFSLAYAEVSGINVDDYVSNAAVLAYAFKGDIDSKDVVYTAPGGTTPVTYKADYKFVKENRTITHLTADDAGNTWGKISEGWVMISNSSGAKQNVDLKPAQYITVESGVTVRDNASTSANRVNNLTKNVEFLVNADGKPQVVVKGDTIWGYADKFGEGTKTYSGWVNLAAKNVSRIDAVEAEKKEEDDETKKPAISGQRGTIVNADNANVRESTGAGYRKLGTLARGTDVAVWQEKDGWYKVDSNRNGVYDYDGDGWVSGQYIDVYDVEDEEESGNGGNTGTTGGTVETGLGIVANTYLGVNVRTGPGTGYAAKGKILAGATVEILEVQQGGASKWGRVKEGWICMDYVTMVSNYPVSGTGSNTSGNNGSGSNTISSTPIIFTGTTKASVNIRKTTSLDADIVRTVEANKPVTIHELLDVEKTETVTNANNETTVTKTIQHWARLNDGYLYNPGDHLSLDTLDEITYTVTGVKGDKVLEVMTAAGGTTKAEGGDLYEYNTVTVTKLTIVNSEVWCFVEYINKEEKEVSGWVNMKNVTRGVVNKPVETPPANNNNNTNGGNNIVIGDTGNIGNQGNNGFVSNSQGYRYTGKVIRANSLNVRALPSQTASLTTTLKNGAAMVIYETTISEGMAWGRCDAGWVYLYYVDLQPCNNAVDAKVVYNENTIIYSDANCSDVVGTYARMSVVDIYEQVGDMCRTEQGWVHKDNLG